MMESALARALAFLVCAAQFSVSLAAPVGHLTATLAWDPNPEPDVTDYVLYYGTASGNYPNKLYVGKTTQATVFYLREDLTYFFVVRARNIYALEGEASNEVAYTVPGALGGPVASDDRAVTTRQTPVVVQVLTNDYSLVRTDSGFLTNQSAALSIASVTQGRQGTVAIAADRRSLKYTPASSSLGQDSLFYTVQDGQGARATAMVTVDVLNTLLFPVARDDEVSLPINSAPVTLDVLANDSSLPDPTGSLTLTAVSAPSHGTARIIDEGRRLTYQPNPGFSGADRFTYQAANADGLPAGVTVTVTVTVPSSVDPLPVISTSATFPVSWHASSQVSWFDIFWQEPGRGWQRWLRTNSTSALFTGQFGHQYSFYSRATDADGNVEQAQKTAEAATLVMSFEAWLENLPPQTVTERETLTVQCAATDPSLPQLNLTYRLVAGPSGVVLDPATGLLVWTPTAAQVPSTNEVTVQVSDNDTPGRTAVRSFSLIAQRVRLAAALKAGIVTLTWNCARGRSYQVQSKSDLSQPGWSNLGNPVVAAGRTTSLTDNLKTGSRHFYRVLLLP